MLSHLLSAVEHLSPVPQFPHVIPLERAVKSTAWTVDLFAITEHAALWGVGYLGFDLEMSVQAGAARGGKSTCPAGKTELGRQGQRLQPPTIPRGHGRTLPQC